MKLTLKNTRIIAVIGIFFISFLSHFAYGLLPNPLFAITFPVNESIWEHMKIPFTSSIIYGIIDYYILNKNNIKNNNYSFQLWFTSIIIIPIYLLIYLPIYQLFGENLLISILLLFIVYIIKEIISYYILKLPQLKIVNKLLIPIIIITYLIFAYLTYFPPNNYLFYDTQNNHYGIKNIDY